MRPYLGPIQISRSSMRDCGYWSPDEFSSKKKHCVQCNPTNKVWARVKYMQILFLFLWIQLFSLDVRLIRKVHKLRLQEKYDNKMTRYKANKVTYSNIHRRIIVN